MNQNTRHIKMVLYKLKRLYGVSITFYKTASSSVNLTSGKKTRTYTPITVKRAIVLPGTLDRRFVYDLAYIASNKNFTEGGLFDQTLRTVILETKDLPTGYVIDLNVQCVYENETYCFIKSEKMPESQALMLTIKGVTNSDVLGA